MRERRSERGEAKMRKEVEPATRVEFRGEELEQVLSLAPYANERRKRAGQNNKARRGEAIERSREINFLGVSERDERRSDGENEARNSAALDEKE